MQYNGVAEKPYATAARNPKSYNLGAKAPSSNGYAAYTPPRTGSSEIDMPGWTTMPDPQKRHSGVFVADGSRRGSAPLPFHRNDVVARHLLVETALLDSQNFELLAIEEVDALKKEKAQLEARLESTRRKLALESKVRDAAQSLHRLYTDEIKNPSPTSPKKQRTSFLGERARSISATHHPKTVNQAGDELATSQKKIDDLLQILSGLESRRQYVESRLLRHTSAVLQLAHSERSSFSKSSPSVGDTEESDRTLIDNTINGFLNGSGYEESIYSRKSSSGMNGFMNAFGGMSQRQGSMDKVSNERLLGLQSRLDGMNSQIRTLIQVARRNKASPEKEDLDHRPTSKSGEDALSYLETQIDLVDKNMSRLEQECTKIRDERQSTETQLVEINKQLYLLLQVSDPSGAGYEIQAPPATSTQGAQVHLNYLEESMLSLENILQGQSGSTAKEMEAANAKVTQYESTMHGLWEIVSSSNEEKEPFSLQGFSTRVQHTFDKATHMDQQAEILRRQIQQQRELNSKSDSEKDKQLGDLHSARAQLEREMTELRERHVTAEAETHGARAEMESIMKELEHFRVTAKSHETQKQQVLDQLNQHQTKSRDLESTVADYEAQLSELQDDARLAGAELEAKQREHDDRVQGLARELAEAKSAHQTAAAKMDEKHREAEGLEAEVVRLTTELTMAKAELDSAYGSRAERAKEVATAELEELRRERDVQAEQIRALSENTQQRAGGGERMAVLEKELAEMAEEYQELTRESVEVEKDREQLEGLVDGLRERCETLETQLSDEKVRWLGVSSPTAAGGTEGRETTSAMVLRNEFKKMMRETRAENARLLRAEQDERKKLEAMIRNMRREGLPNKGGLAPR